jgi:hypothetical protein
MWRSTRAWVVKLAIEVLGHVRTSFAAAIAMSLDRIQRDGQ